MTGQDYPIEHFLLMVEIAKRLKSLTAQLLRHEYHYESFGSWLFTYRYRGEKYRLLFDGKVSQLILQLDVGGTKNHGVSLTTWKDVEIETVARPNKPNVDQLMDLVEKAAFK